MNIRKEAVIIKCYVWIRGYRISTTNLSWRIVESKRAVAIKNYTINITLNNYGALSNIQINQGQISFNLNITGLFQFNVVGTRVQTYQQNRTYIPDQNFEQALVDAGYDTTIDTYIDDSSMLGVTQLDLSNIKLE